MNENHELQQESDKMPIDDSSMQISENADAAQQPKFNPRFVGVILAWLLPGAPHMLAGYWKTGIAWYISSWVVIGYCVSVLVTPSPLSFSTIIAAEVFAFIYLVLLFSCSYRPTRRLGCYGWIAFIVLEIIVNNIAGMLLQCFADIQLPIGSIQRFSGVSMYPTIKTMPSHFPDITVVHKSPGSLRRGDIVSFIYETDLKPFGKRIVGLPGETIDIKTPYVFINGKKLLDPPIFETISSREQGYSGFIDLEDLEYEGITLPITLGPDEYFVLGDNSTHSADSRYFGPVRREKIVAKIVRIVFPPWRIREL